MLLYVATWLKMLNDDKKIGVYCSDVSGAFDPVCSARLLAKLASLGLHRDLVGVVKSWLRERQAFVVVASVGRQGRPCLIWCIKVLYLDPRYGIPSSVMRR